MERPPKKKTNDVIRLFSVDFNQAKDFFKSRKNPELAALLYDYYEKHGKSSSFVKWLINDDINSTCMRCPLNSNKKNNSNSRFYFKR